MNLQSKTKKILIPNSLSNDEIKNEIFVYNKEFRRVHLGNSNIPGVFTLGKSTKEDMENIEKLKKEKDLLLVELKSDREVLSRKKKSKKN